MIDELDPRAETWKRATAFQERQAAYWRSEARKNYLLGFMDLARLCEGFASEWDFWEVAPCSAS